MEEVHIYVSGRVQGVGFRAAVHRHAELYGIRGYVQNLPDGSVEICAQGKESQFRQFLSAVQSKPGLGSISRIETKNKPLKQLYGSFEMR